MPRDYTTNLIVQGSVKGFSEVTRTINQAGRDTTAVLQQQARGYAEVEKKASGFVRLGQKISGSVFFSKRYTDDVKEFGKALDGLRKEMQDVAQDQYRVVKAMEGVPEGTKHYKLLEGTLKDLNREHGRLAREASTAERAFKKEAEAVRQMKQEAEAARGAFLQGFLQGAVPGATFLQRGPGAVRQAAGVAVGRGARAPFGFGAQLGRAGATGVGMSLFQGVGGVAQGLAGIPMIGGALAGQLQTVAGFAQGAIQLQRQRLGLAPQLYDVMGTGGLERLENTQAASDRVRAAARGTGPQASLGDISTEAINKREAQILEDRRQNLRDVERRRKSENHYERHTREQKMKYDQTRAGEPRTAARRELLAERQAELDADFAAGVETTANFERRKAEQRNAARRARNKQRQAGQRAILGDIRRYGKDLMGVSEQEALQVAGSIVQAGGGTLSELRGAGLLDVGMAARTRFGVQEQTIGAFLGAQRRGGMVGMQVGAPGAGGEALAKTLAEATALGLKGSEVNDYLQTMAQGFMQWRQTGMPLNPTSIAEIGKEASSMGLGVLRGVMVARGAVTAAQRISGGGPQSGVDIAMMRAFGGFRGGGMREWWTAMENLEGLEGLTGEQRSSRLNEFVRLVTRGAGSPHQGMAVLHRAMGRAGMPVGRKEARLMYKRHRGTLTDEERQELMRLQADPAARGEAAKITPDKLVSDVKTIVTTLAPNMKRQAGILNQQLDLGSRLASTVQTLEQTTLNTNRAFTDLVDKPLASFSKLMEKSSRTFPMFVSHLEGTTAVMADFFTKIGYKVPNTPASGGQ